MEYRLLGNRERGYIRMKKVVIIGAGPAGITAGYELVKKSKDYDVTILEESSQVGGIAKTVVHNGNRMDLGGHRFITKSREIKQWWEEILSKQGQPAKDDKALGRTIDINPGGPDPNFEDEVMLVRKRVSSIYFNHKFFEYPVKFNSATIKNLGLGQTAKAGFSYLESSIFKKKENNLENYFLNHFGKQLYQNFFEGYTEKLWGRHPSSISADWGSQRLKGISVSSIIKDKPSKNAYNDNGETNTSLEETFLYPKLGPGQMWELAAAKFTENGGKLRFGCHVTGIESENNVIKGVRFQYDNEEFVEEADIVISSMPVKDLIAGMKNVPFSVSEVARGLPYRDLVVLGLLVPALKIKNTTKNPTVNNIVPDCWIYVQDTSVKLGRIQIYNNWSPYLPEKSEENVWIGLEYFCNEGDYYWNQSDVQWQTLAVSELVKLGIIDDPPKIIDFHRELVKKAYPGYYDTYSRFDEIVRYLDSYPNLYCVGRNGQHRYNNMDHTMMTSLETVRNILAGRTEKTKIWSINMASEHRPMNTSLGVGMTQEPVKPKIYVEGAADNRADFNPEEAAKMENFAQSVAAAKEQEAEKKKGFNPMQSIRDRLSHRSVRKPKPVSNAVNYALLADDNDSTSRNSFRNAAIPIRSNYQEPSGPVTASQTPVRRKPSGVLKNGENTSDTYVVGSAPVKKEHKIQPETKVETVEEVLEEPVFAPEPEAIPAAEPVVETVAEPAVEFAMQEESVVEEMSAPEPEIIAEPEAEPVYEQPEQVYTEAYTEQQPEAVYTETYTEQQPEAVYTETYTEQQPEEVYTETYTEQQPEEVYTETYTEQQPEQVYTEAYTEQQPEVVYTEPYYQDQTAAAGETYEETYDDYYADYGSRNEEYDSTYGDVYQSEYTDTSYETTDASYEEPAMQYAYQEENYAVETPVEEKAEETAPIAEEPKVEEETGIQKSNDFGTIFAMPTEDETRGSMAKFDMPYVPVEQPVISLVPKKEDKKEYLNQTGAAYAMEKIDKVLKTEITLKPKTKEEAPEIMVVSVPKPSYRNAKGVFTPKPITEEERKKIEEEERAKRPIAPSINFKKEEPPKEEEIHVKKSAKPRKRNFVKPKVQITADWETMNAKTLRELPELESRVEEKEEKEIKVQKSDLPTYDIYGEMSFSGKKKEEPEKSFDAASVIEASIQSAQAKEAKMKEIAEARAAMAAEEALYEAKAREAQAAYAGTEVPAEEPAVSESATPAAEEKAPVAKENYVKKKAPSEIEVPKDLFANAKVIAVIKNGVKTSSTTDGKQTTDQTVKKTIQKYTSDFETTTVKSIRKLRAKRQEEAIQNITRMLEGNAERKVVEPRPKKTESVITPAPFIAPQPVAEPTPVVEPAPVVESTPVVEPAPVFVPEPVVEEVPVVAPEPIVEEMPVAAPESVVEEVVVAEPEPVVEEVVAAAEPEPAVNTPAEEKPVEEKKEEERPSIKLDLRLKDGSHRTAPIPLNRGTTLFTPISEFSESQLKSSYRDIRSEEEVKESLHGMEFKELPPDSFRKYDEIKHAVIPEMTAKEKAALGIKDPVEEKPAEVPAENKAVEETAAEKPAPKKRGRKPKAVVEAEAAAKAATEENGEPKEEVVKKPRKPRAKKTTEPEGQISLDMKPEGETPTEEVKPKRTYRKRTPKTEDASTTEGETVKKTTRKPRVKKEETMNDESDNIG